MNIILIGFMGTGKSAVGKRLAKRLGWPFVDVDHLIEDSIGMSIPRIFSEKGEAIFRRIENRCISRVVRQRQQVIATGGGAFIDPENRARLKENGLVVCLTAQPQDILSRVGRKVDSRPLLQGTPNPLSRIKALLHERSHAYAQADLTVDTTGLSVEQTEERLWEQLSPYICQSWQYLLDHAGELAQHYGGKYVVVVQNRVVASGLTQLEAYRNARLSAVSRIREGSQKPLLRRVSVQPDAGIYYIPLPKEPLPVL